MYIADFGMTVHGDEYLKRVNCGTKRYWPPLARYRRGGFAPEHDWFSYGVILYNMASHPPAYPFAGDYMSGRSDLSRLSSSTLGQWWHTLNCDGRVVSAKFCDDLARFLKEVFSKQLRHSEQFPE